MGFWWSGMFHSRTEIAIKDSSTLQICFPIWIRTSFPLQNEDINPIQRPQDPYSAWRNLVFPHQTRDIPDNLV